MAGLLIALALAAQPPAGGQPPPATAAHVRVYREVTLSPDGRSIAAIETDACKARLRANTDGLIARGGFGSPTIFVGNEMFFGNDRLPLVRAALEAEITPN